MKERMSYYDLLRGLAIIGVVAIHSTWIGYTINDTSFYFNFTVIWRQVLNFSVPLFLTISGFFLANIETNTIESYLKFVSKQVQRVLIPYLLWCIVYLGIDYLRGISFSNLAYRLFTFSPIIPFYFIILIIEYYFLLPILQKLATVNGLTVSACISGLCCFLVFYFRYYTEIRLPLFVTSSAPSWLIFFVLGIYLRNNVIKLSNSVLIFLLISGLAFSLIETYILYYKFHDIVESVTALKISSFVYSVFIILLAFKNSDKKCIKAKYVVCIGEISFGIYLSHMFFMDRINSLILKTLPILKERALLYQFILIALTLSCCILFALIARRINKAKAVKYLGQ